MESQPKPIHRKLCKRYNHPGHAHELTFSCYKGCPFLKNPTACHLLAESIRKASGKYTFAVWAYVFMPEHIHLLIYPHNPDYSVSVILQSIKQPVSRSVIAYHKQHQTPHLEMMRTEQKKSPYRFWQAGGGYDRNVNNRNTIVSMIRYIHENPVRRKLVSHPKDWYYSSYKDWKMDEAGPIEIDRRSYFKA